MHVGGFGNPSVKRVFFDGVRAGVTRGVCVDDARLIDGDHAVVGVAQEALRNRHRVGVDAFKNPFNDEANVVAKNGRKRLVRTVNAVRFARFSSHIAPRDGGGPGAVGVGGEQRSEQNRLVRWPVVFNQRFRHRVLTDESNVLVRLPRLGVVGQQVRDGIVTRSFRVRRDVDNVRGFVGVKNGDGGLLRNEVGPEFPCDLVVRSPNTNLEGVRSGVGEHVVDGIVVQPRQGGLAGGCIEDPRNHERRENTACHFDHGFVDL